jgi:hypothetical protein
MRWYSGRRCGADRKVFLILLGKSTNAFDSTLLLDVAGQGGARVAIAMSEVFTVRELVQHLALEW